MAVKVIRLDFLNGCNRVILPQYIKESQFINALADCDTNMCFWACLAVAEGCRKDRWKTKAKQLFQEYYFRKDSLKEVKSAILNYKGFNLNELGKYEEFNKQYSINVVSYVVEGKEKVIEYVRKSPENETRIPLYFNLYLDHFSYITNLEKLANQSYLCNRCAKKFRDNCDLQRHIDTCTLEQKDKFDKYSHIYETKLNDIVELCYYFDLDHSFSHDYLITFDFESILQNISDEQPQELPQDKLKYVTKHIPVSVSIATNVPGFSATGHFILSQDPSEIIQLMFKYFDRIAAAASLLMKIKMHPLIEKVSKHYDEKDKEKWLSTIDKYCSNIPVVGFNSGGYDINLVSNCGFIKEIYSRCNKSPFIIKDGNRYKVIKTYNFTFLDQMNFCAAGTDLRSFIKAYTIQNYTNQKGYFPYEWFDSFEKLDYLVSDLKIEYFNSSLKNTTMSEEDFTQLIKTCNLLNLITVRDLLEWYNNLDVGPMLQACLKQKEFYYTFELDMYKDAFTLPGLAEKIMFQFSKTGFKEYLKESPPKLNFHCYPPTNIEEKIAHYIQQDIKAGRCLEDEEDPQYITKEEVIKLFKKQNYVCYYCWFTGTVHNWSLDRIDCSKPHISGNCVMACVSCNRQRKTTIIGKFYKQKALLRFAKQTHPMINVIDESNKRVFYKLQKNIVGGPSIVYHRYHEKDKTTIDRLHFSDGKWSYDAGSGKTVDKIVGYDANALYLYCLQQEQFCGKLHWIPTEEECKIEYAQDTKDFTKDKQFEDYHEKRELSPEMKELQNSMKNFGSKCLETFFGLVEVDIEVPEEKYNYFGEMPPFFKNIDYNEEVAGPYMKNIIETSRGKLISSRKLVASLKATRIILSSNLLKWYIEHGCIVTKVYGIIPAQKGTPFKTFGDWVSDERRKR